MGGRFARAAVEQRLYPQGSHRVIWALYSSENIDTSNQMAVCTLRPSHRIAESCLAKKSPQLRDGCSPDLAIDALCQHPEWASKIMPDGKPLSEDLKAWEQWAYDWLKARATAGLFVVSAPQHSLDSLSPAYDCIRARHIALSSSLVSPLGF